MILAIKRTLEITHSLLKRVSSSIPTPLNSLTSLFFHIPDLQSNFFANTPNFLFFVFLHLSLLYSPEKPHLSGHIASSLKQLNIAGEHLPSLETDQLNSEETSQPQPILVPVMWLLPYVGPVRCCSISVVCFTGLFS